MLLIQTLLSLTNSISQLQDKQSENMIEKLCIRFKNAESERQWRDVAYCLSLLSYTSDKAIRKWMEGLPLYADKLHEPFVFKCMDDVLGRVKKNAKLDMKTAVEEFETKFVQSRAKCLQLAGLSMENENGDEGEAKREGSPIEEVMAELSLVNCVICIIGILSLNPNL